MRLWIVANADFPNGRGGTPRIRNIALGLCNRGHSVEVLIPHAAGYVGKAQNKEIKGLFKGIRFEFLNNHVERPLKGYQIVIDKLVGNIKLSFRLLLGAKPQSIIVYNYSIFDTGLLILLAKLLKVKVFFDVCDERFDIHAVGWEKSLLRNINVLNSTLSDNLLFRIADGFFVVSRYLDDKIRRLSRSQPVLMLPLVADISSSDAGQQIYAANFHIAYLGSLIPDEGIELLIEAVGILKEDLPEIKCDIIGGANNPGYESLLREKVKSRNLELAINFVANISHEKVVGYLKGKTLLMLPRPNSTISRAGFPGKLAEYIASRRPIVTTDFGDITRYFRNLETAFVCYEWTAQSFASICKYALGNRELAEKIGNAAYRFGLKEFDIPIAAERIENFLLLP